MSAVKTLRSEVEDSTMIGSACNGERDIHPNTRIIYVTYGTIISWILKGKIDLSKSMIILDEAHGTDVYTSELLYLLLYYLKLGVVAQIILMSATLPNIPNKRFTVTSIGTDDVLHHVVRKFSDVDIPADEIKDWIIRELEMQIIPQNGTNMLAFLAGVSDIMYVSKILKSQFPELEILILHSKIPQVEIQRAIGRAGTGKNLVFLVTNCAESSVTIPGIDIIVDSLQSKQIVQGIFRTILKQDYISRSSAEQRGGRTGRTGKGEVLRPVTEHTFDALKPHDDSELHRLDQPKLILKYLSHSMDPREIFNFEEKKYEQSLQTMIQMGVIDADNQVTKLGHLVLILNIGTFEDDVLAARIMNLTDIKGNYDDIGFFTLAMVIGWKIATNEQNPFIRPTETSTQVQRDNYWKKSYGKDDIERLINVLFDFIQCQSVSSRESKKYAHENCMNLEVLNHALDVVNELVLRCYGFKKSLRDMTREKLLAPDNLRIVYFKLMEAYQYRAFVKKERGQGFLNKECSTMICPGQERPHTFYINTHKGKLSDSTYQDNPELYALDVRENQRGTAHFCLIFSNPTVSNSDSDDETEARFQARRQSSRLSRMPTTTQDKVEVDEVKEDVDEVAKNGVVAPDEVTKVGEGVAGATL